MTKAASSSTDDEEAWANYPDTILEVKDEPVLRIDLRKAVSAAAGERLAVLGFSTFAVMTAQNPDGEEPDDAPTLEAEQRREAENEHRLSALERALQSARVAYIPTTAHSADGEHAESCFAMQLDARAARRWAERFSQLAYFFFDGERFWLQPGTLDKPPLELPPPVSSS
jgi:hypothetical protein